MYREYIRAVEVEHHISTIPTIVSAYNICEVHREAYNVGPDDAQPHVMLQPQEDDGGEDTEQNGRARNTAREIRQHSHSHRYRTPVNI